ncbi:MAG: hypothetical protein CMQ24_07250 [Gammaproteobacteria bacterium]|nr:hypothetical protein [Gammaproteobacteria bacterium]
MDQRETVTLASRALDRWLDFTSWAERVPSLSVGVAVNGETFFARAYGFEDLATRKPATPSTLYRIASHSKLFTATAIMKLLEAGRLRLDDPISEHLGWFESDADANLVGVTVRELLTHSSGMNRDGVTGHWLNDEFPQPEAIRDQARAGLSVFESVEHWKYSNMGFTILGQVIEAVTGSSYENAVIELVVRPMGLTDTAPDFDESTEPRHATGYGIAYPDRDREQFAHVHARAMNSATGFSSNVPDLLRFYARHQPGGGDFLSERSRREMQRVQFQDGPYAWGLGFAVDRSGAETTVGHGGAYPGYMTASAMNPATGVTIVVLTSAMDGRPQLFLNGIASLLRYAGAHAGELAADASDEPAYYDRVAGFYGSRWGVLAMERLGGKLVSIPLDLSLPPGDGIGRFAYLGDGRFRFDDGPQNGMFGEDLEFVEADSGFVMRSGTGDQGRFSFAR